ncbi:integrase core domain-containing protein [Paraburkholderia adhaesiva]|uniref:integrase core domain-containing protein n=1 Tax=Paraburkholderia adhaesiva TaxID=2883244 RepID=UPI0035716B8B
MLRLRSTTVRSSPGILDAWAYEAGITLSLIWTGKAVENTCVESFDGHFPNECLNEHWFTSSHHASSLIESWRIECNKKRPHSSLGYVTPNEFKPRYCSTEAVEVVLQD